MKVCAVIPAYNEAARISPVIAGIRPQVAQVLVVDDGSSDDTEAVSEAGGAVVLRHTVNAGKGKSLRDGLDRAAAEGFDAVLTLDADGQHLPTEAEALLTAGETADLVVGNRMSDTGKMPFVRRLTNRTMSGVVSWLARTSIPDSQSGYRFIRTDAWQALRPGIVTVGFDFESDILIQAGRLGLRVATCPISTVYGNEQSKIRPVRDTLRFLRMVARKLVQPPPTRDTPS